MIRSLSENAYGHNMREHLLDPFGFFMVYRYATIVESEFALTELIHILHRVEKSKIYNKFQEDCFLKLEARDQVWIHTKILLLICNNRIDSFEKLSLDLI
jgi:hypothetical protein